MPIRHLEVQPEDQRKIYCFFSDGANKTVML